MSFFSPRNSLRRFLAFGIITALGCAGEGGEADGDDPELAAWQPAVSEESARPASCPNSPVDQIHCTGKYCDDIAIHCSDAMYLNKISSRWLPAVSEEDRGVYCSVGEVITGVSCSGKYCDNVSVECSVFDRLLQRYTPAYPDGTGELVPIQYGPNKISEEYAGGILEFAPGYYPFSLKCSGKYCDNLVLYATQMDVAP